MGNVTIQVVDANNKPQLGDVQETIAEDLSVGSTVTTFVGTDADEDTLTYSLQVTNFACGSRSGLRMLQRLTNSYHTYRVARTDLWVRALHSRRRHGRINGLDADFLRFRNNSRLRINGHRDGQR